MALVTRELNNSGAPLYAPDGTVLSGATITFTLVGANGAVTDTWDANTNERISGAESTTTDESGEFSVDLWPNDRGATETYYSCTVSHSNATFSTLKKQIPSGAGAYTWVEFYAAGETLSPSDLSILQQHISDAAGHSSWQVVSSNTTAEDGGQYLVDSSGDVVTITAIASPSEGNWFEVVCLGDSETNAITIDRNGSNIEGAASNMTISQNRYGFKLVYSDASSGWVRVSEVNIVRW